MDRRTLLRTTALTPLAALLAACAGTTPGPLPPLPVNITVDPALEKLLTSVNNAISIVNGSGLVGTASALAAQAKAYVTQIIDDPAARNTAIGALAQVLGKLGPYLPFPASDAVAVVSIGLSAYVGLAPAPAASARMGAARAPQMSLDEASRVLAQMAGQ